MSIFFPYSPSVVINNLATTFSLSLSSLTEFETLLITIISNLYFFIYWGFIIYLALKIFNRIYERIF